MTLVVIANILIFVGLLYLLNLQQRKSTSLSKTVLFGLILGSLYGLGMQFFYDNNSPVVAQSLEWINGIGEMYVGLLKMIIMPLVLVSMVGSVVKLGDSNSLGKISGVTIAVLMFTTAIAALIGIVITQTFGLSADGLIAGTRETANLVVIDGKLNQVNSLNIPQMLVSFIPVNPFADLAGTRKTSIIAVVIFGALVGVSARKVMLENKSLASPIRKSVDVAQAIVMRLVKMIMAFTPYGIAALMTKVVASSSASDIVNLFGFIIASYIAIFVMFIIHGILVSLTGLSFSKYFKMIWPVLTFAFSSRSSAATIPLNVETQIEKLNVPPAIANLSASLGATIGQNGCAGIYPAMLAVMVAPTVGIDPFEIHFMLSLIGMIVISSFGIAGVGGGATFAALIVLPTMGLPVTIVALLISIEPLIDMARTALNVSGAMVAGVITTKVTAKDEVDSSSGLDQAASR